MLNATPATRVFVATQPVDLRGGFNRLFALTQSVLQQDPISGHWFVFANRSRNRLKILLWTDPGCLCAKRLEKGRFSWPCVRDACATLRAEELIALLSGLEVRENPAGFGAEPGNEKLFKKVSFH